MRKEKKKRLRRIAERREERRTRRQGMAVTGTLQMTQSGFGFLTPDPQPGNKTEPELFVPAKFVGSALDGDRVRAELLPPLPVRPGEKERGPVAKITEIISRARDCIVGELLPGSRIRPLNPRLPEEIAVRGSRHGAKNGDWVRLKLTEENGFWHGRIRESFGRAGTLSADLDAVMAEYEIPPRYTETDDAAALEIFPREISRIDCRKLDCITLDPADAKDFDDALSLVPGATEDTVELGVHIADVAAFIAPKSRFDEAALLRGFSCYLPGRTLPMLPPALTAKISMRQGEDSIAHSVFLTVRKTTGEVLNARRAHTVIRVAQRLNYDEVQQFCDTGTAPVEWAEERKKQLRKLLELTRAMRKFREEKEKFIELPLPEIRVICDENADTVSGISARMSRESEQLIEECMLAANQAVGLEMTQRGIAGLYRVHALPEAEKTAEFADLMLEGFGLMPGDISDRKGCRRFIASLPDDPRRPVILSLLLRSLPRAEYSTSPEIHFALGKTHYAHFTSPIRRYTDLLVHQQLWNADNRTRTRSSRTLEKAALWCSGKEEQLDNAYYAASDRLKLRYLAEKLRVDASLMFEGVIVKVSSAGLQVDIAELGLYGFVPKENLRGDFRKRSRSLKQENGEMNYQPGHFIYLQLARIDFARGRAVFVPAGR